MMAFKGGRGITAPYETTHIRVPTDLKPHFEKVMNEYKRQKAEGTLPPDTMLDSVYNALGYTHVNQIEAEEIAKGIANQKKSAKISLSKLLTRLYGSKLPIESL